MPRKPPRRVRTEPKSGVDPFPQAAPWEPGGENAVLASEDRLGAWGDDEGVVLPDAGASSNDDRLNDDRPPHYA